MQTELCYQRITDIPALTALRFFAAFFVFLSHALHQLMPVIGHQSGWLIFFSSLSAEGMSLFFVLSGFVIHYNYSNLLNAPAKDGVLSFFIARFARVYPLFLVALLFDFVTHNSMASIKSFTNAVPYYLTLTQSWFYVPMADKALIYQFGDIPSISWSVSTEWFLYMIYPLICFRLSRVYKLSSQIMIFFIVCLTMFSLVVGLSANVTSINLWAVNAFGAVADINNGNSFFRWLLYFSPYLRASEFLIGVLTAAIYMQLKQKAILNKEKWLSNLLLILSICFICTLHYFASSQSNFVKTLALRDYAQNLVLCFGFTPSIAFIVFYCVRYSTILSRFFKLPILLIAGEASYSLYLFHTAVIYAIARETVVLSSTTPMICYWANFLRLLLAFCASMGLALVLYNLIEVPARQFVRTMVTFQREKFKSVSQNIN